MANDSQNLLQLEIESNTYFKSVIDNALYGIATTIGTDFRFVRVNDAFCRLLEYDRDELVGVRSIADVTHPDNYSRNQHLLTRLINNEVQQFQIEKQYVTKSGRCIDVIVYVLGFYDHDGTYIGSTGSIMDITESNELLHELSESRKELEELAGRLLSIQEEERKRLARELHDDLAQRLALLSIEVGRLNVTEYNSKSAGIVHNLQETLITISEDVHKISRQLHPSIIEDLGLEDALRSEIHNFSRLEKIPVEFEYEHDLVHPPSDVALCLFRVTQESLRNIKKHADAKNVTIQLVCKDRALLLTIDDDGRGFTPEIIKKQPGLGLKSMRERMRLVNGSISYFTRQGRGTTVEARVNMPF